jgi:hypothetical protein
MAAGGPPMMGAPPMAAAGGPPMIGAPPMAAAGVPTIGAPQRPTMQRPMLPQAHYSRPPKRVSCAFFFLTPGIKFLV